MKFFLPVIIILVFSSSNQNELEVNPEKMSEEVVWIKDSSIQGYIGATAVMDIQSLSSEELPLERLFKFLDSNNYVSESN